MYGYLWRHPDGKIQFRTQILDNKNLFKYMEHDWMKSIYGEALVEMYEDMPIPKGKAVRITMFMDSGLFHCCVTGKASTGFIQFVQQTPVNWGALRQATVEHSMYGSEYIAA